MNSNEIPTPAEQPKLRGSQRTDPREVRKAVAERIIKRGNPRATYKDARALFKVLERHPTSGRRQPNNLGVLRIVVPR